MLDENLQMVQKEVTVYPTIPADVYPVELLDITSSLTESYDSKQGKTKEKEFDTVLSFQFVLLEGEYRLRSVWNNFIPNSLYISKKTGKNKLFKIVEALLGRDLEPLEVVRMNGKFLNSLIGKHCRVVLEHTTKGEKTYTNPVNWMKSNQELPTLTSEEREKCKVKMKPGSSPVESTVEEGHPDYIKAEDIPF